VGRVSKLEIAIEVAACWIAKGYPVRTVLRICGVSPSTYYYRLKHPERRTPRGKGRPVPGYSRDEQGNVVSDIRIKTYIRRILQGPEHMYGYRKITETLRQRYKLVINKKKVYRMCKEMGILEPPRPKSHTAPRRVARNKRTVCGPNQLWQMDIKYGYVAGTRRHFFVASIIDVFDRSIVGYYRGKSCKARDMVQTLHKAMLKRGVYSQDNQESNKARLVIRTDNGPQFDSKEFRAFCREAGIEHEQIPVKTPEKNAYIESFHSILECESFRRNCFSSFEEAFEEVDRFIQFYNNRRIHGSLKYLSPAEYLRLYREGIIQPKEIAA